jgi:uncharacterized protein with ParB-like and HNH nuclease domain
MQIKVEHPTVEEVFTASFYEVPAFQREYVWTEAQVNSLLTDALDALFDDKGSATTGEYFIGSIVAYLDPEARVFQLIDGQQRITTLFIVLCALRDARKALADPESLSFLEGMIQYQYQKPDGTTGTRLRLQPLYEDASDVLQLIATGQGAGLVERKLLPNSAGNMLVAYETVKEFLKEQFNDDVVAIRIFQAQLTQRVRLVRIQTLGISDALRIFETINDRGVGLNALDLLKNLLFMQVPKEDFGRLTTVWKNMVHTIEKTKTGRGEKPLRFLRYFVLANFSDARKKNKPLTEDDLYEWLSEHKLEIGITAAPIEFAKRLHAAAQSYRRYVAEPDFYLANIYALSARARQHLIVLLACESLPDKSLAVVTQQLERLLVAYVLAQEPTKVLDGIFADAAPRLGAWIAAHQQDDGFDAALQDQLRVWVDREIDRLRPRISDSLDRLNLDRKNTCRFVLCRLAQHLEWVAGSPLGQARIDHYAKFEVEHVLPYKPEPEQRCSFDKAADYDHYKQMAGNLTLLEKPINASIGRDYFATKKLKYQKSGLFMTKSLAESQSVGANTGFAKAAKLLSQHARWQSSAIETRQTDLKNLAIELWAFGPRSTL